MELGQEPIDENIVDHNPYRGQPEGRRGQDWAVAMVRKAFPDLHFTEDVVLSDGEFVCGRWTMTGTHTGVMDLFRVPPTGRPVAMTGQEIFRVSDGKFTEVWHQEDVPGMLSQLGLEPPALMLRLAAQRSTRPVPQGEPRSDVSTRRRSLPRSSGPKLSPGTSAWTISGTSASHFGRLAMAASK